MSNSLDRRATDRKLGRRDHDQRLFELEAQLSELLKLLQPTIQLVEHIQRVRAALDLFVQIGCFVRRLFKPVAFLVLAGAIVWGWLTGHTPSWLEPFVRVWELRD